MSPSEKIEVSSETITELFAVMRDNARRMAEIDKKITELCVMHREKERRCEGHEDTMKQYGKDITMLKIWQAEETGRAGFLWKFFPLIISATALMLTVSARLGGAK